MSRRTRSTSLQALAILALVLVLASVATAASSRKTSGTAWVGITHQEADTVFAAGDVTDKLLGRGAIVYETTISAGTQPNTVVVTARKVTLYLPGGTLTGAGKATERTHPDGTTTVENGTAALTKGTGKYKGRRLRVTFAGPFKDGVYTFTYSGTLR